MRVVILVLVLATAFYAKVNCEESAATVAKTLELKEAGVKGGDRHEDEDRDKDIKQLSKKLDLLRSSLLAHQRQFAESQQQTKMLQAQLQSENETVTQLQQQVSKLQDESVKNKNKHHTQDKDYANLLTEIKQLQSNLTTQEQQLEASQQQSAILQSQLQIENTTLVQLQGKVSDLNTANAISDQKHQTQDKDYANMLLEIQQLKSNLSSNQQQLNDTNLQTKSLQDLLQSKTTTIEQLQRQVSDLTAANVTAVQEIKQLKLNVATQQSQLTAIQQKSAVQWVKWSMYDPTPENAVFVGNSYNNIPSYIGRTYYNDTDVAVKVCPTIAKATFSFYGQEVTATSVEILTGTGFSWGWGANGDVPSNALSFGKLYGGAPLYIGRFQHFSPIGSSLVSGSIIPKPDGNLYIPFDGKEFKYNYYQVLCHD